MNTYEQLLPGNYYHIYNRANNNDKLFVEEKNYSYFLQLCNKHILPVADIYCYCLLSNHFHFLMKMKDEIILEKQIELKPNYIANHFSNLFNAYAKSMNSLYDRKGSLFQERFRRKQIISDSYFTELVFYIHANPQKHGITNDFRSYRHSSYASIISNLATKLNRTEILEWFGGKDSFIKYHDRYRDGMLEKSKFLESEKDD